MPKPESYHVSKPAFRGILAEICRNCASVYTRILGRTVYTCTAHGDCRVAERGKCNDFTHKRKVGDE